MLFTSEDAQKISNGLKMQHRQPVRDGEQLECLDSRLNWLRLLRADGRTFLETGKTYAVQPGRGKKGIGHIKVIGIRWERVNAISEADALAEGYEDYYFGEYEFYESCPAISNFRRAWDSIFSGGMAYWSGPGVWVIELELVK